MHKVAVALLGMLIGVTCYGESLEQEIRVLRPQDTAAGEKSVLDNLQQRARAALASLKHPRTQEEADAARAGLRAKLQQSLGVGRLPWPPNLQPRTVGSLTRDGYRIEKIVFQTLPGVQVPAHLYIPDGLTGRAPAVLFYIGHWWPDSKARPDFQAFSINMARHGFVVLTWDPFGQGERGISSRDHRRTETLLVGVAQQGIAEYETRCALEYLLSRKEVDPERIGMTGASGGGYNTWITAALDDRIKVAVPVVGTSDFYEQISVTRPLDWYHASEHCHFVPGLIRYADNHEFVGMIAPRPLMIIAATKDQSFPIEGVKRVYEYGRSLYSAPGLQEKIGFFEDSSEGHGFQKRKREAAYGWMLRWLKGQGNGAALAEPRTITTPFDAAELRCFRPGENQPAGPGIVDAVRRLAAGSPRNSVGDVITWPRAVPADNSAIRNVRAQRITIASEEGLSVPAFVIRPTGNVRGLIVAIDDAGKEAIFSRLSVDELISDGWAVLGVDPRGIGELKTSQMGWAAAVSLLLNENFVARQAFDISRAVDVGRAAFADKPVAIYARGDNASLAATYVLGRRPGINFYVLQDGFVSFRSFYERPQSLPVSFQLKNDDRDRTTAFDREIPFAYVAFNALRSFDLPQILSEARARGLVADPIDGDWNRMGETEARKILPAKVALATGYATDTKIRNFLRDALR